MDLNGESVFVLTILLYIQAMNTQVISGVENSTSYEKLPGNMNIIGENERSPVLSRRKRFLVFPDGSSVQLVFCVQTAALITIGDIFLYGSTMAIAWTLPTDPKYFHMLKGEKINGNRRGDIVGTINYLDENGKTIGTVPYQRRRILNPTIAKRSVDSEVSFKEKLRLKINRIKMHENQMSRDYLKKEQMDKHVVDFHRSSRVGLYGKIERMLSAVGHNGRQCVLYKLCESARASATQGSFLQEMLRIVFTLPKGDKFEKEEHWDYDTTHKTTQECSSMYPECELNLPMDLY